MQKKAHVAIVGYGVIGKRVADAVSVQDDMQLVGIADTSSSMRVRVASAKGYQVYSATKDAGFRMKASRVSLAGHLEDLLAKVDIVVDCTPKNIAKKNVEVYQNRGVKFILHGGEPHALTCHSFVAESNYASAIGKTATRIVSCNTTSIVRTLGALKKAGLLNKARGTLLRRATDPWESHAGGIMNTLVPEPTIPSHQGPDAKFVDPDLDVVTMAVKVPQTLAHLHYWNVELAKPAKVSEVIEAFGSSTRIKLIRVDEGMIALNSVKELMADLNRTHDSLYEVALWEDLVKIEGTELFYAYMVDNQAIVIPETIDAIRAMTHLSSDATASIRKTNKSLGIGASFL